MALWLLGHVDWMITTTRLEVFHLLTLCLVQGLHNEARGLGYSSTLHELNEVKKVTTLFFCVLVCILPVLHPCTSITPDGA